MFEPQRLARARQRRGLTKSALAKQVGVTPATVTRWESGDREPDKESTHALAAALRYPAGFFQCPPSTVPTAESVSFRARSNLTARSRDAALAAGALAFEIDEWLSERFRLPTPNLEHFSTDSPGVDPEAVATIVREEWGIGLRPIRNLMHLMESRGIRVFTLTEDTQALDAFCTWNGDVPFVMLGTAKTPERNRFDLAHELGHLVMHRADVATAVAEREADLFAQAFLMPATQILSEADGDVSLRTVHRLKFRWGVSAFAMAVRMGTIGAMTEWQARQSYIHLSKAGYRTAEPNGQQVRETSQVLSKCLSALRQVGKSHIDIARDLRVPPAEVAALLHGLALSPVEGGGGQPSARRGNLRLVN